MEFKWVGSSTLEKSLEIRKTQRRQLMAALPSPLYWRQFPGDDGRKIFWNWTLLQDYLNRGNTTDPAHQALVEKYLASIEVPA
jgi:hypothetical protein